ncbi:MAG: hypothetical protein WKG07_30285 [Hymenobacter sp.]
MRAVVAGPGWGRAGPRRARAVGRLAGLTAGAAPAGGGRAAATHGVACIL